VYRLNKEIPDTNPSWNLGVRWGKFYENMYFPQITWCFCDRASWNDYIL